MPLDVHDTGKLQLTDLSRRGVLERTAPGALASTHRKRPLTRHYLDRGRTCPVRLYPGLSGRLRPSTPHAPPATGTSALPAGQLDTNAIGRNSGNQVDGYPDVPDRSGKAPVSSIKAASSVRLEMPSLVVAR